MRKFLILILLIYSIISSAQTKKNGTIYIEHPAINIVESMLDAFVKADTTIVSSYLSDNFKSFNGSNTNKLNKGSDKKDFLNQVLFWNKNIDYLSIERSKGSYPDALEYKDGENDNVIWVQTWNNIKGVHKATGVKLDMPFHRLYVVNKANKITVMVNYYDEGIGNEIRKSHFERTNGIIYNHHEYINKVRRMMHAFENNDLKLAYSFFSKKARFSNINLPQGSSISLDETKAKDKQFFEKFKIVSIDIVGNPDYLKYELGNAKVVYSWWNVGLIRKSDEKTIVIPIMFIHYFNDKGFISNEISYFNLKLLEN